MSENGREAGNRSLSHSIVFRQTPIIIGCLLLAVTFCQVPDPVFADDSAIVVDTARPLPQPPIDQDSVRTDLKSAPRKTAVLILKSHQDSLLAFLSAPLTTRIKLPDLPQSSSGFEFDPRLARIFSAPWGELESLYPLGFSPADLSRVEDFFGDASIVNPTPLPTGEQPSRFDLFQSYYFLPLGLSKLYAPFGRPFCLYERPLEFGSEASKSDIYVTRGRGGFANTSFDFVNHYGPVKSATLDGSFLKSSGMRFNSNFNLDRMRMTIEPEVSSRVYLRGGLFFNRLEGSKLFFPTSYVYSGGLTDNYSGAALASEYSLADSARLVGTVSYRKDDQHFRHPLLDHRQQSRFYDLNVQYRVNRSRHYWQADLDLRLLRLKQREENLNKGYFHLGMGDLIQVAEDIHFLGSLSVVGSSDLKPRLSLITFLHWQADSSLDFGLTASHCAILPSIEMLYLPQIAAVIQNGDPRYRISGQSRLESGRQSSIEAAANYHQGRVSFEGEFGYAVFNSLPSWEVSYNDYLYGDFGATAVTRDLLMLTASIRVDLPHSLYLSTAYGYRRVFRQGINHTYGPEHLLSAIGGRSLLIPKLGIMLHGALGLSYRSTAHRYVGQGSDGARTVVDAYFGFDLKRFHFFLNYHNLFNYEYSLDGLVQPTRSLWWGFTWELID